MDTLPADERDVYFCPECGGPFTKLGDKLRHMQEEHPDRPFQEGDELPATGEKSPSVGN